jgi:DNA-binding response OmpR family regulator
MPKRAPVLIVEDEGILALDAMIAVEDAHFEAIVVDNVADALTAVETLKISAAILDFMLKDGVVTPLIQALRDRGIAFAVVSASPSPEIIRSGVSPDQLFTKPCAYKKIVRFLMQETTRGGTFNPPGGRQAA